MPAGLVAYSQQFFFHFIFFEFTFLDLRSAYIQSSQTQCGYARIVVASDWWWYAVRAFAMRARSQLKRSSTRFFSLSERALVHLKYSLHSSCGRHHVRRVEICFLVFELASLMRTWLVLDSCDKTGSC